MPQLELSWFLINFILAWTLIIMVILNLNNINNNNNNSVESIINN